MSPPAALPRRLIARLDIKGPNLVKGIHLEGLRVIGAPATYSRRYYEQGADELLFMDIVASLYGRNNLADIVQQTAAEVFVPMTVGGGIRTVEDVYRLLRAGADKVAINTAAIARPALITEASRIFGCQCPGRGRRHGRLASHLRRDSAERRSRPCQCPPGDAGRRHGPPPRGRQCPGGTVFLGADAAGRRHARQQL